MKDEEFYPILNKIVNYCGYAERCFQDVNKRLYKLDLSEEVKDRIVDYLVEHDVVDEKRFALSFSFGKMRYNKWGKIKIRAHLKAKGISEKDIHFAFNELEQEEYLEILRHILQNKYNRLSDDKFSKTVRHAQSRGFELHLVLKQLNALIKDKKREE